MELTFCACWAIINTSSKSYIPRATSNNVFASTRKMIYFTASSTNVGSSPVTDKTSYELLKTETTDRGAEERGRKRRGDQDIPFNLNNTPSPAS